MVLMMNLVVLLVAVSQLVASQNLRVREEPPNCATQCIADMELRFGALNCASDQDFTCLCSRADFKNGIFDCSKAGCSVEDDTLLQTFFNTVLCPAAAAAVTSPLPSTSAAEPAVTTAAPMQPSTEPAATVPMSTEVPITTSETPAVTSTVTSAVLVSTASEQVASTSEQLPTSSAAPEPSSTSLTTSEAVAAVPTTTSTLSVPSTTLEVAAGTPTPSAESTTTAAAETSATVSAEASKDTAEPVASQSKSSSPSGLSISAIAGISAGGAALVLAASVILFLTCRRRRADRKGATYMRELKISQPMPGAGRYYGQDYHTDLGHPQQPPTPPSPSSGHSSNELEMRSRRYEDMVPRMAPKLIR